MLIFLLSLAGFVLITTEFVIIGLLPALTSDLAISQAQSGWLVTIFAFTIAIAGPPLTSLVRAVERRTLFVAILLIFAATNFVIASAQGFWLLAAMRILQAATQPVFWGIASETATRLAGPENSGAAIAKIYTGFSMALTLGLPIGVLASIYIGWRGSFVGLGVLSLLLALAIRRVFPRLAPGDNGRQGRAWTMLRRPGFIGHLALSAVAFIALFAPYAFIPNILHDLMLVASDEVGLCLLVFGAFGLFAMCLVGKAARTPLVATLAFLALFAAAMLALRLGMSGGAEFLVILALWGTAHTAMFPLCQIRVMTAGPELPALAATLNISAVNAGKGLGALAGGKALETGTPLTLIGLSLLLIVPAALLTLVLLRTTPPRATPRGGA